MSELHLHHIRQALHRDFDERLDMEDLENAAPAEREKGFLSRSLAVFPIAAYSGVTAQEVALFVTDGTDDNGVDAIYYDTSSETFYLVQSKWVDDGNGSPAVGDVQKFVQGFRDLIAQRFDRFNSKLQKHRKQINAALDNSKVHFELLFVYSGVQEPTEHVSRLFDDLEAEMNDVSDLVRCRFLGQGDVHGIVSGDVEGDRIDLEVALFEWGRIGEPYEAVYGQVAASDVAAWWTEHGNRLLSRNIRKFIGASDVNQAIQESVGSNPATFWYFNNGITALCEAIEKKPVGGQDRQLGQFVCSGFSVVNGAQTVGSIAEELGKTPKEERGSEARVFVRIISLADADGEFPTEVTRATNTQNRIVGRDFVALDGEQERLRVEMQIDGLVYALKTGDAEPTGEDGCSLTEATVALACGNPDLQYAVQAKREIGRFWDDIESRYYKSIFNPSVTSVRVWRSVLVLRAVEAALRAEQKQLDGRPRQLAVHGNRIVLHLVLRSIGDEALTEPAVEFDVGALDIQERVGATLAAMTTTTEAEFANNYLASLFKNQEKCRRVVSAVDVSALSEPA